MKSVGENKNGEWGKIILKNRSSSISILPRKIKDAVKHEFSTIDGVKEDVISMILNLKKIKFATTVDEPVQATLSYKGVGIVTAKDIDLPAQLEIANPEQYICEITAKSTDLVIEITVEKGLGFVSRESLKKDKADVGTIYLDASFTPVRRASYEVENMRVGDRTDHNRLTLAIETDGTVAPRVVMEHSIETMIKQLQAIIGFRAENNIEDDSAN